MKSNRRRNTPQNRSAARLAAVQALYGAELTGASADAVLADFLDHGIGPKALAGGVEGGASEAEVPLAEFDPQLFAGIVRGVLSRRDDLDTMVAGALRGDWTVDRLEEVLRAILRAGAHELTNGSSVPPKVAISEYVDIAHAFYSGPEPGLVNAVLDHIARVLRPTEIGQHATD